MNTIEIQRSLRHLRLSGMAATLEARLLQAQKERMAPLDLVASLVKDSSRRGRTDSSSGASSKPAFATLAARSTASTSTSTRR